VKPVHLPIYNRAGLEAARETLKPYIRPYDTLMLVSGNGGNPLDVAWLERSVGTLRETFPENQLVLATAGLAHLARLAESRLPASALVYIYEPNFANLPEFSWAFAATLENVGRAAQAAHEGGYELICKPTGRPLYQPYLYKHGWRYEGLAERVDALFVQTQTYCHKGPEHFAGAVRKLAGACEARLAKVHVQVTVDPGARNGAPPPAALACALEALSLGFAGLTVWWSPGYAQHAAALLEGLRG